MKYNSTVLILIIALISQSCKESDNLMEYNLEHLGSVIKIPNTYKEVDKKGVQKIVSNKNDEIFKDQLINIIDKKSNSRFLLDTINPYKFIQVVETTYVPIDSLNYWYYIDYQRKSSSSSPDISDSTFFVGSKMGSIPGFKFIESKLTRKSDNKQRIVYSYLISSDSKTIGITFFGPEDQVVQIRKYINTIRIK